MKELGLITRFGRVFPGREKEAVDIFAEATKYYGDKLADGSITFFEPFLFFTGDHEIDNGFFVMKGPEPKVIAVFEDPKRIELELRAGQICGHLTTQILIVGEDVLTHVGKFADVTRGLVAVG